MRIGPKRCRSAARVLFDDKGEMMKKVITVLFGTLILFSCTVLPDDWSERLDFTGKPYTGTAFDLWESVSGADMAQLDDYVQCIDKSQSWKGYGTLSTSQSVYYIFNAKRSVRVNIDWRDRETTALIIDYKKVGTEVKDYGVQENQITMAVNDYLLIRITSSSLKDLGWELGFTVN
jgi:hypothetical protein